MTHQDPSSEGRGLSRRAAMGAAAWTVPALTVAAGAPAFAASELGQLTISPGLSRSVPRTFVFDADDTVQSDDLVVSGLVVTADRTVASTPLSLTITYVPDDPDEEPFVQRNPAAVLPAEWTSAMVNPLSPTSNLGEAVRYSTGGFTGSTAATFSLGTTLAAALDNQLMTHRGSIPGRWRVLAEAAGFAPAELFLASPVPSGSGLDFQAWGTTSASRGTSYVSGERPDGILLPPSGLSSDYKVRVIVKLVGAPASPISELEFPSSSSWTGSGSLTASAGMTYTSDYSVPKGRAFYMPRVSYRAVYSSGAIPALTRFEWSVEIVGTTYKKTFTAMP